MNTVFNLMIIHFHYEHRQDFLSGTNSLDMETDRSLNFSVRLYCQ